MTDKKEYTKPAIGDGSGQAALMTVRRPSGELVVGVLLNGNFATWSLTSFNKYKLTALRMTLPILGFKVQLGLTGAS